MDLVALLSTHTWQRTRNDSIGIIIINELQDMYMFKYVVVLCCKKQMNMYNFEFTQQKWVWYLSYNSRSNNSLQYYAPSTYIGGKMAL